MSPYTDSLSQTVISLNIHQALGLQLVSQSASPQPTATIQFTSTPLHLASTETMHGGISSLAIDVACFLALIPTLSEGQSAATIASSFQITGAVPGLGKIYKTEGRVVRRGRDVAFCEGEVMYEGVLIAKGNITKRITSPKKGDSEKSKL